MKKQIIIKLMLGLMLLITVKVQSQQTTAGSNYQNIPQFTQAQREAIAAPATGTIIYQTDNGAGFYSNEGTPEAPLWKPLSFGSQLPAPEATDAAGGNRSGTKGFLPPRLTDAEMYSIASPAEGLLVYNTTQKLICVFNGAVWHCATLNEHKTIITSTGRIWMANNLGAQRTAQSTDDELAYGYHFQWGRLEDGHQRRYSNTTTALSPSDIPGHSNFILSPSWPKDWRSPKNDNLWQGINGINNPCPNGFRLPSITEATDEMTAWNAIGFGGIGAYGSLKLTWNGARRGDNGSLYDTGIRGYYWSSTINGDDSWEWGFYMNSTNGSGPFPRSWGIGVRCIKD